MMLNALDSVFLAADDLDAACRPYERLGLNLSPVSNGRRTLLVGGPANLFAVHFLSSDSPLTQQFGDAARPLLAVALRVADLDSTLGHLETKGIRATRFRDPDADMAWLPLNERTGTDLVLVQMMRTVQERHDDAVRAGLLGHAFPLRRLDHLAAVTHDLDEKACFWAEVLGVPVVGEVVTPTMIIRQLRIGDAVLELLGPASPDSPVWKRPAGLVSMASWEVDGLDSAVSLARAAGFTVSDAAVGVLPGTRIATIQGADLAGVNMQLLEYV